MANVTYRQHIMLVSAVLNGDYLIGLAIVIVAVSASSITVMRLKPREILSKMS